MKIVSVCPDSYAANTYLLVSGDQAFAVDPSVSVSAIKRSLERENAALCGILLTHGHFDHTVSADTLRNEFAVPLMIHKDDALMLTDGRINAFFDFYGKECVHRPAEKYLNEGDVLTLGNESIKVISTPGHSPGSVCFVCSDSDGKPFLVTGDTLFAGSVGRCDLWHGSSELLTLSLKRLSEYDGSSVIYPGHGASAPLETALKNAKYYIDF